MTQVTASITGVDQGTDWVNIPAGVYFDISVGITGTATITLQRKASDGTVYDVSQYNPLDAPEVGFSATGWEWRLYCKTGDFTSGPVNVGLWVE